MRQSSKFNPERRHNAFWSIVLLFGVCYLPAQTRLSPAITPIALPDVYSNRNVNDMLQDQAGMIWIASNSGLFYYDGITCRLYDPASIKAEKLGMVYRVVEDVNARLWIQGEKGLLILDKNRKSTIEQTALGLPKSLLSASNLTICKGEAQSIFILSGSTIYRWKNNQLQIWSRYSRPPIQPSGRATMMYCQKQKQLYWYVPYETEAKNRILIYRQGGGIIDAWKATSNPSMKLGPKAFRYIITDALGDTVSVYAVSDPNSVSHKLVFSQHYSHLDFTEASDELIPGFTPRELYAYYINKFNPTLDINNLGGIFIYKLSEGLFALNSSVGIILVKASVKPFQYLQNSLGYRIRAIHKDAYGHLIFGSYNGTKYLERGKGTLHHLGPGHSFIWSVLKTSSSNDRFVMRGENDTCKLYFLASSPSGVKISRIRSDIGDKSRHSFNICMAKDEALNGFWHLTNDGYLSFYDLSTDQNHTFSPQLQERQGRVMIATKDGLWLAGHRVLRFFSKPNFTNHTYQDLSAHIPDQIRNLSINALYLDRNQNLWIGTNALGLIQYNTKNHQIKQFRTSEGIAENTVFSILAEPDEKVLWIGTGKGLSRFEVAKSWFDNYYTEDGLSNNEFNTAAAYRASDGMMYMGGQNGINYFHPDSFKTQTNALKQFAVVWLKGAGVVDSNTQQMALGPGHVIRVSPSVKLIEFEFRANEYFHTAQLQYRYRIPGLMPNWAYINSSDKALLSFLPPGKHLLEVQVRSYRGMWLPPVRYHLQVVPPWYKTWWFWAAVGLLIIVLLNELYHYRIRQLRSEFSIRQQLSHDLHDNLGSRMFLLRSLSHQLTNPLMKDSDKKDLQIRLEEISQDMFKSIRDFIWSFDPTQDEVSNLFQRMDDFAENYLSGLVPGGVEINIAQQALNHKLQPRTKHHVLSVYQEILTNMIKHTHVQKMVIDLRAENHFLKISIQNWHNGQRSKRSIPLEDSNVGLESIRHRLAEVEADLCWQEDEEARKQVAEIKIPTH